MHKIFKLVLALSASLIVLPQFSRLSAQPAPYQAVYKVDGNEKAEDYRSRNSIEAMGNGKSAVIAFGGSKLSMTWMRIHKTAGSRQKTDETPGLNASVLALEGSKIDMDNCTVSSHSGESDVAAAVGNGSSLKITSGTYQSTRPHSPIVTAYDGASATVDQASVSSEDSYSPLIYTQGQGSSIKVSGVKGHTSGIVSPLFRGSGEISALDCRFNVKASNYILIEESGNFSISGCTLIDAAEGAILARNTNGVPSEKPSILNVSANKISIKNGNLIEAVNCNSEIVLEKNTISMPKGAAFIKAFDDEFGQKGKNGGHVKVTLIKQAVSGNVIVNDISSAVIELEKGSTLKGAVNPEGRGGRVDISLAKGAVWASNSASNITTIKFEQPVEKGVKQIKSKGDITYDASDPVNAPLGGREYKLAGGGYLRPIK